MENWRLWKTRYEDFATLSQLSNQPMTYQMAMLRRCLGDAALKVVQTLTYDKDEDKDDVTTVMMKLEKFCLGEANETYERYSFNKRERKPDEDIDSFIVAIKELADRCSFCTCMKDSLIRDRIVMGVNDESITCKLLKIRDLTLKQCVDICRTVVVNKDRLREVNSDNVFKVNERSFKCTFCGNIHPKGKTKCPAWGKTCSKCKKLNHFARQCRTVTTNAIEEIDPDNDLVIAQLNTATSRRSVHATLIVGGKPVKFQLDTGSSINLLPCTAVNSMLLEHRNTPSANIGASPAQRLFGRRTRTLVPMKSSLLDPKSLNSEDVKKKLTKRMMIQKKYYDQGCRNLTPLSIGDYVWVQPTDENSQWRSGVVTKRTGRRSYEVEIGNKVIRRNRRYLRKAITPTADKYDNPAVDTDRRTRSGKLFRVTCEGAPQKRKDVMKSDWLA